jgi:hypothetical protein
MRALINAQEVQAWMQGLQVSNLLVISPHLDDAAYSLAGLLSAARERAEVITVFTDAQAGLNDEWAHMTGFANSEAEHRARRAEDALAMNHLGCRFRHLGLRSGQANEAVISDAMGAIERNCSDGLAHTLVLLPGGAGGPLPASRLKRLAWRVMRRPWGSMPHGEHELTRDLFWRTLDGRGARLGFYAEIPYAWSHSNEDLQQRLLVSLDCQSEMVEYHHQLSEKLLVAEMYASQLVPIFGSRPAYRKRVLARKECMFIARP